MKKIIYTFLAVSIIFAACKKEEDNNPPTSPVSIVGIWTPTSVVQDSSQTVTINGVVVDSLTYSGSMTMTPEEADVFEEIEFTNNGKVLVEDDTLDYTYSNNVLTITDEDSTFTVPCSFTQTDLSLTLEVSQDTAWNQPGMGDISISVYMSQTIHCSRNTVINTNVSQRVGNTNHSWFVKPKFNNILKSIK